MDEAECLGQLELAMPAMEEMLARHPDIGIVMALNDPAAMGALAALENAGRLDSVKVYGVDGVPETKEMIAAGHMEATAEQSPRLIGRIAAEQAYRILDGHTVDEAHIVLATRLLTRENISKESIERWE